jgi:predicted nucleotidyltransferase component of viral defense system
MAALASLHWEQLPLLLQEVLQEIGKYPFSDRFYLAGGTALALQLGHRSSADLDFFSATDELDEISRQEIIASLNQRFEVTVDEGGLASLYLNVAGVDVGFFNYSYPLLAAPVKVSGIQLASLLDIGLMKMDAIATRGARKDFYDLYFIVQQLPLDEIFEHGQQKFPQVRDFSTMVLMSMVDFRKADVESLIQVEPNIIWEQVKTFFTAEAKRLGRNWFQGK